MVIGSSATSFSGGSGGGHCYAGEQYGGTGGGCAHNSGKGAGNPALKGTPYAGGWDAADGSGGLLVMKSKEYIGNGTVVSRGSYAGGVRFPDGLCSGGGSGGGSINMFVDNLSNDVLSDVSGSSYSSTVAGGAGSVIVGTIINGQYRDL